MTETHVTHEFQPIVDEHTRVLILGSFPSVKSREQAFYYGHPQNRFWKLMAALLGCDVPVTIGEKTRMLSESGIGIWDVIESCDIKGSSDSSVRNVVPAKIPELLRQYPNIEMIFANGRLSEKLYQRYVYPQTNVKIHALPSTSPANAAYSLERLQEHWSVLLPFIRKEEI